ncbi:MAG: hypothetical protein AAGE05_15390 [Pseudomonadota bacterium]
MNKVLRRRPPGSFWAISILLLIWNGLGVFAYLTQITATEERLAEIYSAGELALVQSQPFWVLSAFAIAVFGGVLGALSLLMRKSWSRAIFAISLIAAAVQHFWFFVLSDGPSQMSMAQLIMPIIIVPVCIFAVWYAGNGIRRGWLR